MRPPAPADREGHAEGDGATMSVCSSCGAPIRWVVTKSGAAAPADPDPVQVLVATGRMTTDRQGAQVAEFEVRKGLRSHFASCPFAAEHRRKR
jgi:hypothetical protein